MAFKHSDTLVLLFPKEETGIRDVVAYFNTYPRRIQTLVESGNYDHTELSYDELVAHTTPGDDFKPEIVSCEASGVTLEDAWKKIIEENKAGAIVWHTWFVLWQTIVGDLLSLYRNKEESGTRHNTVRQMIRFCVEIPNFMSWIGVQTLRDIRKPTIDPSLEVYTSMKKDWSDPNGKDWVEEIKSLPENPLKRLPIHLWNGDTQNWIEGAVLEEHQTTPLMYMNETSPMQGTLLYHYLGKGKSAASIAISRMYAERNIMVMVPASLRGNYEKEIAAFGGNEYRRENEWVFVPVAVKALSGRRVGSLTSIWKPGASLQMRLPALSYDESVEGNIVGYWLPRTYDGHVPNNTYTGDQISNSCKRMIEFSVRALTDKRFRLIHYNAGESTYRQMIRFGLQPSARRSLLHHMNTTTGSTFDVAKEIYPLNPKKEKCWNSFSASVLVNAIVNFSFTNPEWNPFYNSLVIVDESHNFISQMMTRLGNLMYLLRMHALNTRAVLLSGTPIMNHPIEFLFMFDFMKGPSLKYLISTDNNPKSAWKLGTVHSQTYSDGSKRLLVDHGYIGWKLDEDRRLVKDNTATIDNMKRYFGKDGVMVGSGIVVSESRHGVVFGRDAKRGNVWNVDKDATLVAFQRNILNAQQNGFRTETDLVRRMIQGTISYQGKTMDISSEFPDSRTFNVPCEMARYQSLLYLQSRMFETEKEQISKTKKSREEGERVLEERDRRIGEAAMNMVVEETADSASKKEDKGSGMYRIFSRQVCNMAFPPYVPYKVQDKSTADGEEKNPVELMKSTDCWLPSHPLMEEEAKSSLVDYSTKYAKALEQIMKSPGLVLLYTFFRVREGIEMFTRILEEHGGRRVKKSGVIEPRRKPNVEGREIEIDVKHPDPVEGEQDRVKTTVCVGDLLLKTNVGVNETVLVQLLGRKDGLKEKITDDTEVRVAVWEDGKREEKEGKWGDNAYIPFQYGVVSGEDKTDRASLISLMRSRRNRKGVDATVLMITKAGAEGLDLKSIRQVHVIEPFWNEVRVKQVLGRGSRNKSHNYLEPAERKVDNFVYRSVMTSTNALLQRLMKTMSTKSDEELARELLSMTPEEIEAQVNPNIKEIVSMESTSKWSERLTSLYGQFVNDGMITSDEFVMKTSERKQVLIDQALKLFSHTSIEALRTDETFRAVPVFLTPFTVYNNPNIPIENYFREIRDSLAVRQTTENPTPRGRFRIPVYYVPFYVIDRATNKWKEEIMELNAEFTLKADGSLEMEQKSPIDVMVGRFEQMFRGKRFSADPEKHMEALLRQASRYVRSKASNVPIIFMNDSHKEAIMKDLVAKKSRAAMDRVGGVYREMMVAPIVFRPDDTVDLRLSDRIKDYWSTHGFKG